MRNNFRVGDAENLRSLRTKSHRDLLKFLAAEVKLLSEMGAGVMNKQKVNIRELKHFSE